LFFRVYLEDRFRESLRADLFPLPDVKQTGRFFAGAAGDGHVVFILTLPFGFFSFIFCFQMSVDLLLPFFFFLSLSLFPCSCWLEGAQQEGGVSFVGRCGLGWSRPCGLSLCGLDLAASAFVVSTLRPQPLWSRPCGLGLVVSTLVVSTLWSRSPRWSRPVRSRPRWPRPCCLGFGGLDLCGLGLRGFGLGLCSLDLSVGVI
jgi:hypothetical protein